MIEHKFRLTTPPVPRFLKINDNRNYTYRLFLKIFRKDRWLSLRSHKKITVFLTVANYLINKKPSPLFSFPLYVLKSLRFLLFLSLRLRRKKRRYMSLKTKRFTKTIWLFAPFRIRQQRWKKQILIVNAYRSLNNLFVYVTDYKGKTLFLRSSGSYKFKGSKRISMPAATLLAAKTLQFLMTRKKVIALYVIRSNFDRFLKVIVNNISFHGKRKSRNQRLISLGFISLVPISHNGVRKRKARRV